MKNQKKKSMTYGEVTKQRLNTEIGEEPIMYRGIPRLFVWIRLVSKQEIGTIYIYIYTNTSNPLTQKPEGTAATKLFVFLGILRCSFSLGKLLASACIYEDVFSGEIHPIFSSSIRVKVLKNFREYLQGNLKKVASAFSFKYGYVWVFHLSL